MAKLRSAGENGSSLRIAVPSSSFANGECQVTECGGSIDAFCKFLAYRKPITEMVSATFIIAHDFFPSRRQPACSIEFLTSQTLGFDPSFSFAHLCLIYADLC